MSESVIVAGARTPIGKHMGALGKLSAVDLGAVAIKAALDRAGITGDDVGYVIMGHVLAAGVGQGPARQAALKAGIPHVVPTLTVNKVCLSGMTAIALADQLIRAGEQDIVVAGGMESMTQAPHLLPGMRAGVRAGSAELVDSMFHDGLTDFSENILMGESTDRYNTKFGVERGIQDEISVLSHQRAAEAQKNDVFRDEIIPVKIGDTLVTADEGIRPGTSLESLGRLRPSFIPDGTITAGNASQISDGASALVVMRRSKAEELGLDWLAEISAHGMVAGPDNSLHSQPSCAIQQAMKKARVSLSDLDHIEINEAFAAVVAKSIRDLGVDMKKINSHGGAIALGHPIGASGARIVLHLAQTLNRRGGGVGAAGICGGGGQGEALIIRSSGSR
ncbi:acetyl-CoA C-acetyltransferase [Streptomyces sp. NPDC051219]|uniref:acetyl-CoA C-acetyltransferase n=1 Tax=Streptomyces sp. NPDC051219 TaxID=3155283 RepID=UPI0034263006